MGKRLTQEEINQLIGFKKDKITVIGYDGFYAKGNDKRKRHYYICKCSCGTTCILEKRHIIDKRVLTASCGCNLPRKHGLSKHPAYNSYKCMMGRVKRPHPYYHKHYIENNISVCEEWYDKPENFLKWAEENGFKKGLSLDRIDNLKGYSPENCRWVDAYTQANNRSSYNHMITHNGKTQSLAQWARETGIPIGTLGDRVRRGLSEEEIFNTNYRKMPKTKNNLKKKLF